MSTSELSRRRPTHRTATLTTRWTTTVVGLVALLVGIGIGAVWSTSTIRELEDAKHELRIDAESRIAQLTAERDELQRRLDEVGSD